MRFQIELVLVLLLVVLMYHKPRFLLDLTDTFLGKLVLLSSVFGITHKFGRNAGVLTALVVILLMHTYHEGLDGSDSEAPPAKESGGDEDVEIVVVDVEAGSDSTDGSTDGTTNGSNNDGEQEKAAATQNVSDRATKEENIRPVSSQTAVQPSTGGDDETTEPFTTLYSSREAFSVYQ